MLIPSLKKPKHNYKDKDKYKDTLLHKIGIFNCAPSLEKLKYKAEEKDKDKDIYKDRYTDKYKDKDKDKYCQFELCSLSLSLAAAAVSQNRDKAADKFNQIFLRDNQKITNPLS